MSKQAVGAHRALRTSCTVLVSPIRVDSERPDLTLLKIGAPLEEGEGENRDGSGLLVSKVRAFERINT